MFLTLNYQKLDLYAVSRNLVFECYKITKDFPAEERFNLISQIRRAALSVHLNIAEGCVRKAEAERKRFFEVSRSSSIEIDAALDVLVELGYCLPTTLQTAGLAMVRCFSMLSKMIG